jgi:hypothetical protein
MQYNIRATEKPGCPCFFYFPKHRSRHAASIVSPSVTASATKAAARDATWSKSGVAASVLLSVSASSSVNPNSESRRERKTSAALSSTVGSVSRQSAERDTVKKASTRRTPFPRRLGCQGAEGVLPAHWCDKIIAWNIRSLFGHFAKIASTSMIAAAYVDRIMTVAKKIVKNRFMASVFMKVESIAVRRKVFSISIFYKVMSKRLCNLQNEKRVQGLYPEKSII